MKEEIIIEKLLRTELIIMKYLWKKDSKMSKKEIIKDIKQIYRWHKRTIKILLRRLVDKGYLARDIIKFQSHYKIIIDNEKYYTFNLKVDPTVILTTLKDIQTVDSKIDTTKTELTSNIETVKTEINNKIGDTTLLETTDKTNIVSAINEVKTSVDSIEKQQKKQ